MRWIVILVLLTIVGSAVGIGWLFWIQNSLQMVTVSLELPLLGRQGRTWSASELIAVSTALGFLMGLLTMVPLWWRAGRRRSAAVADTTDSNQAW